MLKARMNLLLLTLLLSGPVADAQWIQLPKMVDQRCLALCAANDVLVAITQDSNLVRSTDQGVSWQRSGLGLPDSLVPYILYGEGSDVYLGTNTAGYASTDNGISWNKIDSNLGIVYAFYRVGDYLFMGSDSGVMRLAKGQNWQTKNTGFPPETSIRSFASDDQYLYVGTHRKGAFRSSDGGEHWELLGAGIPAYASISDLWASNGYIVAFNQGGEWYRSTDRGGTWKTKIDNFTLGASKVYCVLPHKDAIICGTDDGVIRSRDNGTTWQDVSGDITSPSAVLALVPLGNTLYAGTSNRWIWRRPLSEILPPAGVGEPVAPYALRLNQSIPNPTAFATEISYSLPNYTPVSLKLYNAMMQEVSTLVDEPQEGGEHHAVLDASGLPSGVYYYRLSAGASSLTRRMVVVK